VLAAELELANTFGPINQRAGSGSQVPGPDIA
jgi:hypothetical protein